MIEPPAHRSPSPNAEPAPLLTRVVPWKYSAELLGIPDPWRSTESAARLGAPVARSSAPCALTLLAQPLFATPALPHGHAVPLPSPEQKIVPAFTAPLSRTSQPPVGCPRPSPVP